LTDVRQKSQNRRSIHYNFEGAVVHLTDNAKFHSDEQIAAEAIDAATLLDRLANLEERLVVISKTVNEEIQLFIASISIRDSETMMADSKIMREDSKVMREDSQIMKQQAARTTLLTTLAVIYLPLQLITGIFGMNVREITGDGGPRWWACLIALGVGGALTFLVYLGVKWWQWRDSLQKKRDGEKEKED
jgi:Mg2+ and Co2+ transporter CorA